jgi:hypothetical protein
MRLWKKVKSISASQTSREGTKTFSLILRYFMKKKRILIILIVLIAVGFAVRFGLPAAMKGIGLHPEYVGQRYLLPEGRALIITTSHDRLGDDGDKTGVFGSELTAPTMNSRTVACRWM